VKVVFAALAATIAATGALGAQLERSAPTDLYGITSTRLSTELSRFDPATLRRVGPRLRLPSPPAFWAFSPDGRELALASEREGLQLVDLRRMRVRARFRGRRLVRALAWVAPRRLILAEHGETFLVDPAAGRIVRREVRSGEPWIAERTRTGLVLLGSDGEGIGPAALDVVGGDGRTRSVVLQRILAGMDGGENNEGPWRSEHPALAVDREGNRAFVVGGSGLVAEVDLATLAVTYRTPLARSLQARAKAASGPVRTAAWLDGVLAVSGYDQIEARTRTGETAVTARPYGLRLLDTRTNALRTVDERATQVAAAGGLLLAGGATWDGATDTRSGSGLTAYRPDGTSAWHLFGDAPVGAPSVHGGSAYVWTDDKLHALDLVHGAVRASVRSPGTMLLTEAH
jgi:hypothetical protein